MNCRSRSLRRRRQLIPSGGGFSLIVRLAGLLGAALLFNAPVALFGGMRHSAKPLGAHRKRRIQDFLVFGSLRSQIEPPGYRRCRLDLRCREERSQGDQHRLNFQRRLESDHRHPEIAE